MEVCRFCMTAKVVPGPRNQKFLSLCPKGTCRIKALEVLEQADMLRPEEEAELAKHREEV